MNVNKKTNTICEYCGIAIYKYPYELRRSSIYFCNKHCRSSYYSGINNSAYGGGLVDVICAHCGRSILRKRSRVKLTKLCFCDNLCKGQYMSGCKHGIKNYEYKKQSIISCEMCGERVYQKPFQIKKFKKHFCSRKCYLKYNVGSNHGKWVDDRSRLKSNIRATVVQFSWYYDWIKNVYARDDYKCCLCGMFGVKLNAHHIVTFSDIVDNMNNNEIDDLLSNYNIPEILTDINNGITLCEQCHRGIKGREIEYVDIFKKLVSLC